MPPVSYKRNKNDAHEIVLRTPALEQAPVYPHVYMAKYPNKPKVEIPTNSKALRQAALEAVENCLRKGDQLESNVLATFLYEYAQEFKSSKLNQDWESYGVKIGVKDEEMVPMDLLKRIDGPDLKLTPTTTSARWEEAFLRDEQ
jgi:Rhabdovirus nucleocapsid protein